MGELAPELAPVEIEAGDGLALIQYGPGDTDGHEFGIWNGEAIVGSLGLVTYDGVTAQVSHWLDEHSARNGYLSGSLPHLSQYAFEQLGLQRLAVQLEADDQPTRQAFEKAGFRLAWINNAERQLGYEIYADKDKRLPPVRVDVDELQT